MPERQTMRRAPRREATRERVDARRTPEQAEALVLAIVRDHADSLLRVARGLSYCADDAHDAYQRTMEILLRHAARLEEADAPGWAHTVCRHEALRLRAQRRRALGASGETLERDRSLAAPGAEERAVDFDRMARSAEALQRLKPDEVKALWLKAQGLTYKEIAAACDWTYTKVNRAITEGRRAFLERYAGIEAGDECRRWAPTISAMVDGEATAEDLAAARPHLRNCPACRATVRELHAARVPLAAVLGLPLPAVAMAGQAGGDHGGALSRIWELLAGPLHEHAAASAARVQMVLEAAAPAKVVAVAASAAAIAGGGVAVHDATTHRARQRAPRPSSAQAAPPVARAAAIPPRRAARAEFGADAPGGAPAAREFAAPAGARTAAAGSATEAAAVAAEMAAAEPAPEPAATAPAPSADLAAVERAASARQARDDAPAPAGREFRAEFPHDAG
jgi:RNA polymerase sigma factor (sigma-70 family)